MNSIINEIYNEWSVVAGKENISFTLAMKADALLTELDYYPSFIWNTEGKIIFEYVQRIPAKNLYIVIDEKTVSGKICAGKYYIEEFAYLTVDTINSILNRFWE